MQAIRVVHMVTAHIWLPMLRNHGGYHKRIIMSLLSLSDVQVAWQSLLDEASEGSVSDDSGTGKASIAGAVLTHRRLLIVSATLSVLTAHVPSPAAPAITSFLWLGPALIFCNAAHQVGFSPKYTEYRPLRWLERSKMDALNADMTWAASKGDTSCPIDPLLDTLSLPYWDRQVQSQVQDKPAVCLAKTS